MKFPGILVAILVAVLSSCTKESSSVEMTHAVEIQVSEEMARDGKAISVVSLVNRTLFDDRNIRAISLTLSSSSRAVKVICRSRYHPVGVIVDQMHIEFAGSEIAVNDEKMNTVELKKRLQQYRNATELTSSAPVVIVQFSEAATINDMIEGFAALSESGIPQITLD